MTKSADIIMYTSKYFKAHELLPPHIYKMYGVNGLQVMSQRLLKSVDDIKIMFPRGAIYINNYFWGKPREWSGLRTPDSPYYHRNSMHSYGRAADMIFTYYDVDQIRNYIINNPAQFPYIKGIELGVSWLHIDTRASDKVVTFYG